MAKKVVGMVKLQIEATKATPAPPVGTALGPQGVNIMDFCKSFNARTAKDAGLIIPVVVTVYSDRSYTFITKTPPASVLLKKAAKVEKGSGVPNKNRVGKVTMKQVEEINIERSTLRVLVTIFGRPTPVELEFVQVQKL